MPLRFLLLLALTLPACATKAEVQTLHVELQMQQAALAELSETVELQRQRLDAQSALLTKLDDRASGAAAAAPPPERAAWLHLEGDRIQVIRSALPEPSDLFRLLRAVPHKGPDGQTDGFRVSGIRPDSPFDRMGFANGDVVHQIADIELTSVQQGMEIWQAVQRAETVEFQLVRRGQPHTITLELR